MPVVGEARHVDEPEPVGDVASEHAAALHRFGELDVVDDGGIDAGALDRTTERDHRELGGIDVDQRTLVGTADRRAGGGDDQGVGHGTTLTYVSLDGHPSRARVAHESRTGRDRPSRARSGIIPR